MCKNLVNLSHKSFCIQENSVKFPEILLFLKNLVFFSGQLIQPLKHKAEYYAVPFRPRGTPIKSRATLANSIACQKFFRNYQTSFSFSNE